MKPDDFFVEVSNVETPGWDMNGDPWGTTTHLDEELLEELRRKPVDNHDDLGVATGLAELVHDDLERFGTGGGERLSDQQMGLAIRALRAILRRLGIEFDLPWRNLNTFRSYWINHDCSGSWQARRDLLNQHFEPLHLRLTRLEEMMLDALAEPVSPRRGTGWPLADEEIRELRRKFRSASTPQDYRAVGTYCIGVLEALSRTVYDPAKHLREGETEPPPDKTKQRLGRYIEETLPGKGNEELRGLASKAIEFAHHIKHAQTPTRREAGVAADAVILLANILRRLEQEF